MDPRIPDVNTVRMAVDLACRAPSVHNSQPWQWTYSDGRLDLFSDRSRLLASADPSARLQAGALEGSNVSPVETMVAMIAAARQFEQQMKVLQGAEQREQAASRLLSPQ